MLSGIYHILFLIMQLFPLSRKKVLFVSYYGERYNCNPKYLSEYIVANYPEYSVVWAFTHPNQHPLQGVRVVKYHSLRYLYELCTCEVLISNVRMNPWIRKRKGQVYIQTWHSSLRLKMIEKDVECNLKPSYIEMAKSDASQTDAILSGCAYSTSIFEHCLWSPCTILPTGTPRNDLLFCQDSHTKQRILKNLGLADKVHIALYAPTFRDLQSPDTYLLDCEKLIPALKKYHEGDWKILIRLHPHLANYQLYNGSSNQILDMTAYDDIQELLYISDIVISDYSSLVFDFAITGRPCFLYVPDVNEYMAKERNLYFDIERLPFPLSKSVDELNSQIEQFDETAYEAKISVFMQQVGTYETGYACENVVKYLQQKLGM